METHDTDSSRIVGRVFRIQLRHDLNTHQQVRVLAIEAGMLLLEPMVDSRHFEMAWVPIANIHRLIVMGDDKTLPEKGRTSI